LLDYVSELRSPVYFLTRDDADEIFNMPKHNLLLNDLQSCIKRLLDRQLIEVSVDNINATYDISIITLWLTGENHFRHDRRKIPFYGLTEKGGLIWEEAFCPEWNSYSKIESSELSQETCIGGYELTIEAGSLSSLETMISNLHDCLGELPRIERLILEPWHPVYWKTVQKGYFAQLTVDDELNRKLDSPSTWYAIVTSKPPWRKSSVFPTSPRSSE